VTDADAKRRPCVGDRRFHFGLTSPFEGDGALMAARLSGSANRVSRGDPDAAYACGIANDHGFMDANRRAVRIVARPFSVDNGHSSDFDRRDAVRLTEGVTGGPIR